jgi:hypothetical protein
LRGSFATSKTRAADKTIQTPIHVFWRHRVGARSRAASDDNLTLPDETVRVVGCGVSNDSSAPSTVTLAGSALGCTVGTSIFDAEAGTEGTIGVTATVCANANFLLSVSKGGGVIRGGGDA